jgi:perosamine synthetase
MRSTFLPYGHQWVDESDIQAVSEVLKSDYLTTGSKVKEFEQKLAEYCGAKYAVTFSSGTSALHGACHVAGIKQGDEVITTPITFFATLASIMVCGGKPVLTDIRNDTINIDPRKIEKRITSKTKAIMSVDFAGYPVEIDLIKSIAQKYGLIVIDDACHALGAEYKGRKIGGLSDITVFSFHPVKSICTGEGGCVTTNNEDFYNKLFRFRNHNIIKGDKYWKYEINEVGYNSRLTDIQCALGISQLKKLDSFITRRREIASIYNRKLGCIEGITLPIELSHAKSSYHLYVIRVNNRDSILQKLVDRNIGGQIHYIPCHLQPVMKKYGYKMGDFPNAEKYYERCISLPIFPKMTNDDVDDVVNTLREVVNE